MDRCEDREDRVRPSEASMVGEPEDQRKLLKSDPGSEPETEPSCVSLKSDWSKGLLNDLKSVQPSAANREKRPTSP